MQAYNGNMSLAKKRELRREAIIAYIKRKPLGTRIKLEEFKQAGNFATDANTDVFIKKMLKDGVIIRENLTPRTFCYQVAGGGEVRVTRPADPRRKKLTPLEIEQLAMKWSWENPDCYNDLRQFIQHITKEPQHDQGSSTTEGRGSEGQQD